MALQSLNLSNARITAKPVSGGRTNLNAITEALQATQSIANTAYNNELIQRKEQLAEQEQLDLAQVENAVANKGDLNSLNLATEAGVQFRDETFTRQLITENSQEAQLESTRKGETLKQAQARFELKNQEDILALGTPEQKALMQAKGNALSRQYSNNAFEQEKARIATEKSSADKAAVFLALGASQPPQNFTPEQKKQWYSMTALQDINVASNDNVVMAEQQGWSTEEQIDALEASVDELILKNSNNPSYVNAISENFLRSKQAIQNQGAKRSVERSIKMRNNEEQAMTANFYDNLNSPNAIAPISDLINNGIANGQFSVDNAKYSLIAKLREYNSNGEAIPQELVSFVESDRPDGRSGWAYTDATIGSLLANNQRILNSQGKATTPERTPQEKAEFELTLEKRIEEGVATRQDIEVGLNGGYISDTKAVSKFKELDSMRTQNSLNLSLATSLNDGNSISRVAKLNQIKVNYSPEQQQKAADVVFQDILSQSFGNKEDGIDYSLEEMGQALFLGGNANASNMVINGFIPSSWKQQWGITFDQSPESFAANASYFKSFQEQVRTDGSTTVSNSDILKASMPEAQYKAYENYNMIRTNNPDLTDREVSILLSKSERVGPGYIEANYPDTTLDEYNDSVNNAVDDLYSFNFDRFNPFSATRAIKSAGNKNELSRVVSKNANEYIVLNPSATLEEAIEYGKNRVANDYIEIDSVMLFKGTTFDETKRATDYEPYMENYRKQMANDLLGDSGRYEDITFKMNPNTEKTGIYDVAVENLDGTSYTIGQSRMFYGSDIRDNIPSFQNYANGMADLDRDIKQRQILKDELEGKQMRPSGFLTKDEMKTLSDSKAELSKLQTERDSFKLGYANKEVALNLTRSPLYQPILSDKEIEGGYVNIGKRKVNLDSLTDKQTFEVAEQSVKRARQKFTSLTNKEFTKLPATVQNKLAQNYILQKNTSLYSNMSDNEIIKDLYDREVSSRAKLTEMYNEAIDGGALQGSDFEFGVGSLFMFGAYGAYNMLKTGVNPVEALYNTKKADDIEQQLNGRN